MDAMFDNVWDVQVQGYFKGESPTYKCMTFTKPIHLVNPQFSWGEWARVKMALNAAAAVVNQLFANLSQQQRQRTGPEANLVWKGRVLNCAMATPAQR